MDTSIFLQTCYSSQMSKNAPFAEIQMTVILYDFRPRKNLIPMHFPFKTLTNKHRFLAIKTDCYQKDKLKFLPRPYGEPYRNEQINHLAPSLDVVITPSDLF